MISALGLGVPKVRKLKVGDEILSLVAMKMENVLKAEGTETVMIELE